MFGRGGWIGVRRHSFGRLIDKVVILKAKDFVGLLEHGIWRRLMFEV